MLRAIGMMSGPHFWTSTPSSSSSTESFSSFARSSLRSGTGHSPRIRRSGDGFVGLLRTPAATRYHLCEKGPHDADPQDGRRPPDPKVTTSFFDSTLTARLVATRV